MIVDWARIKEKIHEVFKMLPSSKGYYYTKSL